jgi:two-component system, sensor histidine kinase and response regulator
MARFVLTAALPACNVLDALLAWLHAVRSPRRAIDRAPSESADDRGYLRSDLASHESGVQVQQSSGDVEIPTDATRPAASDLATPLAGFHVLLAEDNEINQLVAISMLEAAGATCEVVPDGQLAVERWKAARHEVILMDCQMPRMDGYQATAAIRAIEAANRNRAVPIIALTANALKGDREKCVAAGMNDYLSKPFTRSALISVILEAHRRAFEAPSSSTEPIDMARIAELRHAEAAGAIDLLKLVIDAFESSVPRWLMQVEKGVGFTDTNLVVASACRIRSSAMQTGAHKLAGTAADIAHAAQHLGTSAVPKAQIDTAYRQFEDAMHALRELA